MDSASEVVSSDVCAGTGESPAPQDDPGQIYYAISDFQADESDQVKKR